MTWVWHVLYVVVVYLLGSIPTGYIVAKKLKGIDIREHGSKNIGATNVKRVVGTKAGIFVLIFDFLKGLLPVLGAQALFKEDWFHVLIALTPILGHSRSLFLNFQGGKSAITGLGAMVGLCPIGGLILAGVAALVIRVSRMVSLGSITTAVVSPFLLYALKVPPPYLLFALLSSVYVIYLHKANIGRLIQGTENKF